MPWRLIWKFLVAHPIRSLLTLGSIVVATFLLCMLRSFLSSMDMGVTEASSNRLIVQSAVSLFVDLPHAYQTKIESVDGVETTAKWTWFGGVYQNEGNFFAQFGVDEDRMAAIYPDIELVEGSIEEWSAAKTGCIIGEGLVERFGWQVGDTIPIIGMIFRRTDGEPWTFEVKGVYRAGSGAVDANTLYFQHDYLDEVLETGGATGPRGVSTFVAKLAPGAEATGVMADIDALFENGPQVVQSTTEAEFNRQFLTMMGNVPMLMNSIGGGVLFAIFLAALNTMIMAGRERTQQLGILKALGFTDGVAFGLLITESLILCGLGGLLGVGLATGLEAWLGTAMSQMFPNFSIRPETKALALGVSVLVGFLAGVVPAWRAKQLVPVRALRAEA